MAQNFFYSLIGGKPVDTTCSCTQCNNDNCFGKRQDIQSCSCENCTQPATCLLYDKNKSRSVGCGESAAVSLTLAPDVGDAHESKFQTCCDGRPKLMVPGLVYELTKHCAECGPSATNKFGCKHGFEFPIAATPKLKSSGYVLELPKQNNNESRNEKDFSSNTYMLTKCIQKPNTKIHSYDCHTSVPEIYKTPASVLEQNECKNSKVPGIVYDLIKLPQCRKCNESAKIKSDSFVCTTVLPKNAPECDKYIKRNEYESPNSEHGCAEPQTKEYSQECCDVSSKDHNKTKYVLDLRRKKSEDSYSECFECTKTNKNESIRNSCKRTKFSQKPQSQKNSQECCHDSAIHKSESSGCGFEARKKSNDYPCKDCSKRNGNESSDETKCIPKQVAQKNSCSCHESSNDNYKPQAYVIEPLKPQAQKNGCCDEAKKKLESSGYVLELPINVLKQNDCARNKFKKVNEYELIKCTEKSQAQKNSLDCCHDLAKNNVVAKYELDLRKKHYKYRDSECHKCTKTNENDSRRNSNEPKKCSHKLETRKSSCGCGYDSAKYKTVTTDTCKTELPKNSHLKTHRQDSTKSTTTCSLEYCPKREKYLNARLENAPTIRELMMSTSSLSQLYNKKSKESSTCAGVCNSMTETPNLCCEEGIKEGSSSLTAMYSITAGTLKRPESVVETQKDAYLPKSKLSPAAVYAEMLEKLKQQNSVVEILKRAYQPQSNLIWNSKSVSKKKCVCKHNQRPDRTKETKKSIPIVPCKRCQELVIKKQCFKKSDTKIVKNCSCKKRNVSSLDKTANQELKTPVVESLETDYVTICTECGSKRKLIVEKCPCKQKKKEKNKIMDPNDDIQLYWSTTEASHNSCFSPLRNKKRSPDYLRDIANCVDLPNVLSKKDQKLDIRKQGSKESHSDIQYIPFMSPNNCHSEKLMTENSNALCIGFSNTDQDILKCNTMSDISKISSSKTKTIPELEKNIEQVNINRLETNRFTPDTMHIFYNTNNGCNELIKNKFESPRYSVKSKQYTPTKNAQELFKNILQIHGDELETLINRYQKKSGESNAFTKDIQSESSGDLNELPQSSFISIKQSGSARNSSKSSGCLSKLYTYRTSSQDPVRNAKDFNISRCETKGNTSFHCKDSAKQRSMSSGNQCGSYISTATYENKNGYVFEIPKYTYNSTTQKSGYSTAQKSASKCHDSAKKKKPDPSKNDKHEKKKCDCSESAKHKSEKLDCGIKINSHGPGYVLDLPKVTQICSSCGIVLDLPKLTQICSCCGITELAKKPSKCEHNTPNNAETLNILKMISKSVQSDAENICKNIIGTQTAIIDNCFFQNPSSENAIDLCKDILKTQIQTIEVLKKIYFPQDQSTNSYRTFESTQNPCAALPNSIEISDNINRNKNRTMQPETEKLSAEVLARSSYPELNDSSACRKSSMHIKPKKISKYDIIERLKEAYKACSCKICECVANKSAKPNVCKCEPCECDTSSFLSHKTNKLQICDCKPCDCVQCTKLLADQLRSDLSYTNSCKTKGFHPHQNIIVAPVEIDDTISHVACTCSPCACIECGLVYPLGSTLINEMSTSTNRHALCRCDICLNENCDRSGFDSCKCQMKNKVMSKPVEHDTHDFDIRTAMIVQNSPISQRVCRNDPIAMLAAVPNTYPILQNRPSNTKTCSCKECECMFCVSQKDAIKSFQLLSNTLRTKSDFKLSSESQLSKIQSHDCAYNTYSSLNYETKSLKYSSNDSNSFGRYRYRNHTYGPCYIKETPGSVILPFKKGDVLTPSTHKLKVQNQMLQKQCLEGCCIPKATITKTDSSSTQQDFKVFHSRCPNELTTTELNTLNKIGSITQANIYMNDFKTKYIDKRKTLKYNAYMYCQEINEKRSLYNNMVIENVLIPESCFSDHLSSYYKDYEIDTQITHSNNKSRETFKSSGHKYPEYLIQYWQKGTIKTILKDVMQLDINEAKRQDNCNFIPSDIKKHNIDKMYESMPGEENGFDINNSDNTFLETLRHNYKFGLSNNACVQLSNKNENKHREVNGIQNKERDQLKGACLTGNQYSIKVNNENHEYFKAIKDFNEFHVKHKVFDYDISAKHSLTIHDEHSDLITSTEILNANDYRRVKNTLNEAREFSQELIRLLKSYEKANNEFQSISDKLKIIS